MAYRETVRIRERKAAQRDALLQAAEQLVRAGGFAALAIQSVAQRAGVSVGTVYRYFDNKEALAVEVFERASAREVAAVAQAVAEPGTLVARIREGVAVFAHRALRAPRLAWSLIAEPAEPGVDAARIEYRKAYAAVFESVLVDGVASGDLPQQDCALNAAALVGALAEALLGPLAADADEQHVIQHLQTFCLRAIGAGSHS